MSDDRLISTAHQEDATSDETLRKARKASGVPKVPCPNCGEPYSVVVDTNGPRRRRECAECGYRYNTKEQIDAA